MFIVEKEDGTQITEEQLASEGKLWLDIDFPIKRAGIGEGEDIVWIEEAIKYGQIKDRAIGVYQPINMLSQYLFAEFQDGSTMTIRYTNGKHYDYKAIPFMLNKNIWRDGIGVTD